ncbi:MAG: ATP-binding protein [Clostridiaceae bacterium]|nr:ATP-binding protein [Clostridiaceae bacterium]
MLSFMELQTTGQVMQNTMNLFSGDKTGILMNIHPLIWVGGSVAVTIILMLLLSRLTSLRYRHKKDREMSSMVNQFIEERNKSEAILTDLDVGIIAYGSDGVKINTNPAAKKMLSPQAIPESLKEFIDQYGQDNGIQAAILLGNETIGGKIQRTDRILRVRLKESRFDEGRRAGTIVVLQDITESEREEKQRKEFVANVSHELKTPLTTIKTYSESLLEWGLAEKNIEAIRKDVWRINDDSLRMERLVEDLLLLSSIDSKGIRVRMELLDFAVLVRQAVERLQHQAQDKSLDMTCYTISRIPLVYVDRIAMERVVTNLVSNAIKYTEKGGSVKVYISYLVDDVYVKVTDTGVGIDQEHISRIFNRFYRVDITGSRMFGGTGLGLSIAKELVEIHDGKINVNSVLGKGTEFTVMIPIARKVFGDTLNGFLLNSPPTDNFHRAAAEELLQIARDLKMIQPEQQLSDLTRLQTEVLLDKILDRDEPEPANVGSETKEFAIITDLPEPVRPQAAKPAAKPLVKSSDEAAGT